MPHHRRGIYRFWRDTGYVAGGLIARIVADTLGFSGAILVVAALTAGSGLWLALDLPARCRPAPTSGLDATRSWAGCATVDGDRTPGVG